MRVSVLVAILLMLAGSSFAQDDGRAEGIYMGLCAVCHGNSGNGDGVSASAMIPPPPDFASEGFKSTHGVKDLMLTISKGVPGTQMEGFSGRLSEEDTALLAAYVFAF